MKRTILLVIAGVLLLGAASASESSALSPAQAESYRRLTNQLIALCCWREPIAIHRSQEALQMLSEVEQLVREGRSEDEIKSIYAARYGRRSSLPEPPGASARRP